MGELGQRAARRDFSRIGIALFVMLVTLFGLQYLISVVLTHYYGEQVLEIVWVSLLLGLVPQYLISLPAAYLIIRGMPKQSVEPMRITIGRFCILFLICHFLMQVGNYVGIGVNSAIEYFTGSQMGFFLNDVFEGTNIWMYIGSVVVLAPVIEELFFRKLLISRMERHGEKPAILVSGLMFGIVHGNFSQFFYAFALGLVLGYIYVRTRKIGITIALHMLINLIGGVLGPLAARSSQGVMTLTGLAIVGVAIAGLVMFILRIRKVHLIKRPGEIPNDYWGEYAFVNVGMIMFLVASVCLFVFSTLTSLA